jgi:hypothetical protein
VAETRLTGKKGSVYMAGVKVGELQEWELTCNNTLIEHRAAEDIGMYREMDIHDFTVRAKKYARNANVGAFVDAAGTIGFAADPSPLTIILYQKEGDASTKCFEGAMWPEEASLLVPDGKMVEENVTFKQAAPPTFYVGM